MGAEGNSGLGCSGFGIEGGAIGRVRFRTRRRDFVQNFGADLNFRPRRTGRHLRNIVRRNVSDAEALAGHLDFFCGGDVRRKHFRNENYENNQADVDDDGSGASDGVPLGVFFCFGLDEEIRVAGGENVGLDDFAQRGCHHLWLVEAGDFGSLGRLDVDRNDNARIHHGDGHVIGERLQIKRLGLDIAADERTSDENFEREMARDAGFSVERRRIG